MRYSTMTLGCKANQYDTGTIERVLQERGHQQVKAGEGCDVCIINTCAVTAESVRKSRQAVRRVKKLEPSALIAVCGCYSQLERDAAAALGAGLIGGTDGREGFARRIEALYSQKSHYAPSQSGVSASSPSDAPSSIATPRTRALLKIQDGCDNRCAYCIIPHVRGHSRSVPLAEIQERAARLVEQGHKEIVVTGIEISSYRPSLTAALRTISAAAPGARLRLGSLSPGILTAEFIGKLGQIPNLCKHFHISLQSGCDETLARMGRKYSTQQVADAIGTLRGAFGNCGITADLIVGFPGESGAQFEKTRSFIEKAAFSAMHIFPFSPRKGTKAADMPGQVSCAVKQERARIAAETAARQSRQFKLAQIGQTLDVLVETQRGKYSIGHSGNYLSVALLGKMNKNTLADVKISSIKDNILIGEIV